MKSNEIVVPEMYTATKTMISAYKKEAGELQQQEDQLKAELVALQNEMVENTLSKETAGVSEKVYFLTENKEISSRSRIIESILDELQEEKHLLKVKYMEIYRKSLSEASAVKQQFDLNAIVDRHLLAMFTEITSIAVQMRTQHLEIYEDLAEVFADDRINEEHRNARYRFTRDGYKLPYFESHNNILKKDHIVYTSSGYLHPDFNRLKANGGVKA